MERFNPVMEKELLDNGFSNDPEWEYGPVSTWVNQDFYTMQLMKHDFGYFIILQQKFGGEYKTINIGSSNNAQDIIKVRDALKLTW
jgi:hypothetical protein